MRYALSIHVAHIKEPHLSICVLLNNVQTIEQRQRGRGRERESPMPGIAITKGATSGTNAATTAAAYNHSTQSFITHRPCLPPG